MTPELEQVANETIAALLIQLATVEDRLKSIIEILEHDAAWARCYPLGGIPREDVAKGFEAIAKFARGDMR